MTSFFFFFGCVIQARKQFSQVFSVFFFLSVVTLGAEVPCDSIMQVCVCACVCVDVCANKIKMKGRLGSQKVAPC